MPPAPRVREHAAGILRSSPRKPQQLLSSHTGRAQMYTDTHRTAQEPRGKLSQNIIIPLRTQGHYRAFKTLFYISLEAIAECSQLHSSSSDLQTILERGTAADTTRRSILEALPGQTEPRQTQPSGSDLQQLLRAYRIRHGRRALGAEKNHRHETGHRFI